MSENFHVVSPDGCPWDDFVRTCGGHILQSARWGNLKERSGFKARRIALERDGVLVAGAQVLYRSLLPGLCLAYVPRGPVIDPTDAEACAELVNALCAISREHGAFALKLEPDWQTRVPLDAWRAALQGHRSEPGEWIQPQATVLVDISGDPDATLAAMKPKWRYNIRLAERKGVRVRQGTLADIPAFYRLMELTSKRDHFGIHTQDYYRDTLELLGDYAALFIADYEGEPLAGILVVSFGTEAIYLFGGSSNEHRERMPMYALQWAGLEWAKARGCNRYDLWGISDEQAENGRSMHGNSLPQGILRFKQGFGGDIARYVAAYDLPLSPHRYRLYKAALAVHGEAIHVRSLIAQMRALGGKHR